MQRLLLIVSFVGAGTVLAGCATASTSADFTQRGVVTRVVDGDTMWVRLASGESEKVRLIGVNAAERGACFGAGARARELALSKPVTLRGDGTQPTRDQYGRLLAYVWIPGGRDLGYELTPAGSPRSTPPATRSSVSPPTAAPNAKRNPPAPAAERRASSAARDVCSYR